MQSKTPIEINEAWIRGQAEIHFSGPTFPTDGHKDLAVRDFTDGALSILPHYQELKAENEELRKRVKELEAGIGRYMNETGLLPDLEESPQNSTP